MREVGVCDGQTLPAIGMTRDSRPRDEQSNGDVCAIEIEGVKPGENSRKLPKTTHFEFHTVYQVYCNSYLGINGPPAPTAVGPQKSSMFPR